MAREHQQPLYMCFVDFKKAFDSISHNKLWVTMMDMGYPLHLIDLLAELYRKQLVNTKVAETLSEWFHVEKGVRQGFLDPRESAPYSISISLAVLHRSPVCRTHRRTDHASCDICCNRPHACRRCGLKSSRPIDGCH